MHFKSSDEEYVERYLHEVLMNTSSARAETLLRVRTRNEHGGDLKPVLHQLTDGRYFVRREYLPGHMYVGDLLTLDEKNFSFSTRCDVQAMLVDSQGYQHSGYLTLLSMEDHSPTFTVGNVLYSTLCNVKSINGHLVLGLDDLVEMDKKLTEGVMMT